MRTTQAARYARWSAAIAVLLVLAVAAVYAQRVWLSHQVQREAIPVPASVQEQSAQFTLSKVNGEKTQFTVRASRATEFTEGNRSLLEDVWITAYGTATQRFDNLHTRSCEYVPTTGLITCAGDVQIDLQSSEDARLHAPSAGSEKPPSKVVHIATSHVSFERETGVASTEQPVQFSLPQGDGSALGVRYDSQLGELRLLRDVKMTLRPTASKGSGATAAIGTADVNITGSAMIYRRDDRVVRLLGPVEVQQGLSKLRAGNLNIELDDKLRARKIVATDHPEVAGIERGDPVTLAAESISIVLSPEGWTERVIAAGNVRLNNKNPAGENRLTAGRVELEPVTGTNRPRRMTATDDVTVQLASAEGGSRRMKTSSLIMDFASRGDTGQSVVQHATTAAAALDWESPVQVSGKNVGKTGLQRMRLTSDQLDASFGSENELRELHGMGNVEMQRQLGDAAPVTSASRELLAQFAPGGEWSRVEQTGNVRLRDGNRTAQSDRAQFDHAAGTATLTDSVVITDESSRTTAKSGTFAQAANQFRADGNVVSSEIQNGAASNSSKRPGSSARPSGSDSPAHISADHLVVNTSTGHAVYSGRARLWQGDSVIEADNIELDRATQTLTAISRVRAIFPQTPQAPASAAKPGAPLSGSSAATRGAKTSQPSVMQAEAGRMTYLSAEHRARLEEKAKVRTNQGSVRSSTIDLFFAPPGAQAQPVPPPTAPPSPMSALGGQSLVRATATGNVLIDDGDRHAKGGRADYTAADGKFVLSGDHPTVYDGSGNATNGRQLTFVFADDTIVVDSDEGSRTLTLHRVGK